MPRRFEPMQGFVDHRIHDSDGWVDPNHAPIGFAVDEAVLVVDELLRDPPLADLGKHPDEQRRFRIAAAAHGTH